MSKNWANNQGGPAGPAGTSHPSLADRAAGAEPDAIALRLLTREDLPFADSLRALAGWNQTRADWERFLSTEPAGCFVAEWEGVPAGTATTTVYGSELAWIGMVLVHPDYRRRGIGRALLRHCLDRLRQRQVRCLKLDATPLGRPVYTSLGFKDEWTLNRWTCSIDCPAPPGLQWSVRPWREVDAQLIEALDDAAFGVSRQRVVTALARQSLSALVLDSVPGRIAGYGVLRRGSQALYLGPVVAASIEVAASLIRAILTGCVGQPVLWDIPDANTPAVALARQLGFSPQRPLTRMCMGENRSPGDPQRQFALAGPEIG